MARLWASSWVKLPEISALPPVMDELTYGLETTWPSRTMPNSFCGVVFFASSPVIDANLSEPFP